MNHLDRLQSQLGMYDIDPYDPRNHELVTKLAETALADGLRVSVDHFEDIRFEDTYDPSLVTWMFDEDCQRDKPVITYKSILDYSTAQHGSAALGSRIVSGLRELSSFEYLNFGPRERNFLYARAYQWQPYLFYNTGLRADTASTLHYRLRMHTIGYPELQPGTWGRKSLGFLMLLCEKSKLS